MAAADDRGRDGGVEVRLGAGCGSDRGDDAVTVVEQGWRGIVDRELWRRIQDEDRWLVTAPKELADRRHRPPGTHAGIILFRFGEEGLDAYLLLARSVIDGVNLEDVAGAVIVATDRGVRVRRAP